MNFEELDYQRTALGELILRRRRALAVDGCELFDAILLDIDHTPDLIRFGVRLGSEALQLLQR